MKKIFYYTDVLLFLARGDDAVDKLKRNLVIFKETSENIRLVWHPFSRTEEFLRMNKASVTDEYMSIVLQYKKEGWGDFDTAKGLDKTKEILFKCDAYYGDVSDLTYEAQNAKMPVMLQNIDC